MDTRLYTGRQSYGVASIGFVMPKPSAEKPRAAKRCGISRSEYLRKVGLNKNLTGKPSAKLYEAYSNISDLLRDFSTLDCRYIEIRLKEIKRKILSAYHEKEDADSSGDNENLGD